MILGILSDTHDRLEKIDKAVEFFNSQKIDYVLHAGDYVAPFAAFKLSKLNAPVIGVFGNNDGERKGLSEKCASFAQFFEPPYVFELKGYRIALMHEPVDLEKYLEQARLVVYGHTHKPEIKHYREKAIVNPGEACGYLTGKATAAVVDVKTLKVSMTEF